MKSLFKYIVILAISLLYCIAIGVAGRDTSNLKASESDARCYSSDAGAKEVSFDSEAYTVCNAFLKTTVKGNNAYKLKIPFHHFLVQISQLDIRNLSGFYLHERFYARFPLRFSTVDIIYPFHSFW